MSRKIVQVNTETGEILNGHFVYVERKSKSPFGRHFTMNQEALDILVKNLKGISEAKVLFTLLKWLDYENMILVQQKDIAHELNMQQPNVARSINKLADMGIILKGPKCGRNTSYQLNPSFAWKGSTINHRKILKERMSKAGLSVIE